MGNEDSARRRAERRNTPMPPKPTSTTQLKPQNEITPELEQAISARAYELFEQRGREDGRAVDDWLQAETELTSQRIKASAA
jgi:hypothetical protein